MQLMKTFKHGSTNDHIFKVAFVEGTQLVSGGQDGSAHLYNCRSGLLVEKLVHSHCRFFCYSFISASTQVFTFKAGEFLQTVTVCAFLSPGFDFMMHRLTQLQGKI